jgi:slime mold repeat-containing protein
VQGTCTGQAVTCSDDDPCTTDSCEPKSGTCQFTPLFCDDGNTCTIDRCDPVVGCVHVATTLSETGAIQFVDTSRFKWPQTLDAIQYNDYGGTIPRGHLGSRPTAGAYDHACYESADAFADGATISLDSSTPPTGTAFYYLTTGESSCGESVPGHASSGASIPNAAPCPTPP